MEKARRWLILAICCTSIFLVGLDTTVVNVALPSIAAELGLDIGQSQWVVDSYTLVLASLLMTSGALADRIGRRRVFRLGLVLFAIGSAACALAPSIEWLVAARVAQGIGGSMLSPVALAIVVSAITDPRERAQAIGVWASVFGLSMAAGPVLGGLLTTGPGWRTVFWANLPIIAVVLVLTAVHVPESRSPKPRRVDVLGQILLTVIIGSTVAALIEDPLFWIGAGVAMLIFVKVEKAETEPLMDLRLFGRPSFLGAVTSAVAVFAALNVTLLAGTLYLQETRGLSPLDAGLTILPMAVAATVFAPLSGYAVGRIGPTVSLVVAGLGIAAGGILFLVDPAGPGAYLLLGVGVGFANAPITNTAVNGLPPSRSGVAGGIASTARQVGAALGVALAGHVHAPLVVACGLAVVVAAIATDRTRSRTEAASAVRL
ncbi:MFS transporter [Actinoplanes sp. DH11]|uniref:MFS transporter n=1 Tax=Actinoplanes sp. DH11 TaxID=2857011 RepID=UPI001E5041CA|nr:MFS transporter [Actinoplanes sp. DH11]